MSSRFETIDSGCWSDFDDADLSMPATLLYIWSWTNPKCGMAGLYRVTPRAMTESRVPLEAVPDALAELERHRFVFYRGGWLFVRSRVKHLHGGGPTIGKAIAKGVGKCPVPELRVMFLDEYVGADTAPTGANLDEALERELGPLDAPSMGPRGGLDAPTDTASESEIRGGLDAPSMPPAGGTYACASVSASAETDQGSKDLDARAGARGRQRKPKPGPDQDVLPETCPEHLRERVDPVLAVLKRVHALRGGSVPTIRGVGLALAAFPDRDHVSVAGELEHWATAGNGAGRVTKDWVRTLRTFLERSPAATPAKTAAPNGSARGAGAPLTYSGDFSRFKR